MVRARAGLILAAAPLVLTSSACDEDPCAALADVPATLEIGGTRDPFGDPTFAEIEDGDEVPFFGGPRGLNVLMPSIRVKGINPGEANRTYGHPDDPEILVEAFVEQDLIATFTEQLGLTPTEAGAELVPVGMEIDDPVRREVYDNQTVTLSAEITDACGKTASDEVEVVAVCPPGIYCFMWRRPTSPSL